MTRYVVIGTSGSGKTTLARQIAERLRIPHIELDALHWDPNWTSVGAEVMGERVSAAIAGPAWALDGNYSKVRHLIREYPELIARPEYSHLTTFRFRTPKETGKWLAEL